MLTVPTAKIQIGNQAAITLDTATTNGKKSYQINIVTDNDSIERTINEIKEDFENEVRDFNSDHRQDNPQEYIESQIELERIRNQSSTDKIGVFIPIIAILAIFGYLSFRAYQKRKWNEALLNKGLSLDEINSRENQSKLKPDSSSDELASYDKRKTLKYSIVFCALGLSILFGTIMDDFGYFMGMLFMLLGVGFWYYNERIKF